ncbi:hypothetical protein EOA28_29590 [Mesorhizobium sp. M2A.F.Ca.ET.067.02.1.1]|nr:hypothetical protein EOA28_29590 [Mesorhizobium sp. M2A.F.Ca.ET.067.02.1.1]TIU58559.1 MAG: hypothetical protein E5W35_03835 [Mesorhizobium sp.]
MAEHVAMMRRRGYKYTSQPERFLQFDRFLQLNPQLETESLSVMIDQWAATKGTRNTLGAPCLNLEREVRS